MPFGAGPRFRPGWFVAPGQSTVAHHLYGIEQVRQGIGAKALLERGDCSSQRCSLGSPGPEIAQGAVRYSGQLGHLWRTEDPYRPLEDPFHVDLGQDRLGGAVVEDATGATDAPDEERVDDDPGRSVPSGLDPHRRRSAGLPSGRRRPSPALPLVPLPCAFPPLASFVWWRQVGARDSNPESTGGRFGRRYHLSRRKMVGAAGLEPTTSAV